MLVVVKKQTIIQLIDDKAITSPLNLGIQFFLDPKLTVVRFN